MGRLVEQHGTIVLQLLGWRYIATCAVCVCQLHANIVVFLQTSHAVLLPNCGFVSMVCPMKPLNAAHRSPVFGSAVPVVDTAAGWLICAKFFLNLSISIVSSLFFRFIAPGRLFSVFIFIFPESAIAGFLFLMLLRTLTIFASSPSISCPLLPTPAVAAGVSSSSLIPSQSCSSSSAPC